MRFIVQLKKTATETYRALQRFCLSGIGLSEGRKDVENYEVPGHPVIMKTDWRVEKERTVVRTDCRLGIII
jgi:hypothetical protein